MKLNGVTKFIGIAVVLTSGAVGYGELKAKVSSVEKTPLKVERLEEKVENLDENFKEFRTEQRKENTRVNEKLDKILEKI